MSTLTPVAPVRPVAPYIGGKRNLARRLSQIIETIPHQAYAEVFAGMLGVFLRRRSRPAGEIINDFSADVVSLFRVARFHLPELQRELAFQLASRDEFSRLTMVDPSTLTDVQRAARFLYLQRCAFGGKVRGRNFGMSERGSRFNLLEVGPMLEALHRRLADVCIECLPWRAFVERYDRPGTLLYLDPPYHGSEDDYGQGMFDRAEFAELADRLRLVTGRFVLSINDTPEIRETFDGFSFEAVGTHYGIAGRGAEAARELIITG